MARWTGVLLVSVMLILIGKIINYITFIHIPQPINVLEIASGYNLKMNTASFYTTAQKNPCYQSFPL